MSKLLEIAINRFRKLKVRLMLLELEFNTLLKLIAIDIEIAYNKGITIAIKATNKSL